jgi:carboxymethylenebutenolidase
MTRNLVAAPLTRLLLLVPLLAGLALNLAIVARGAEVIESRTTFQSQGKTIVVERFEPKAEGRHPAILVVHGSHGLKSTNEFDYHAYARLLARNGYVAHVVHYFDRTGHESVVEMATIYKHFAVWGMTVAEAVTHLVRQPNVDPERIGLLGFSLGAYLSLSVAMFDARVAAVVEYYGGLPDALARTCTRMPPTLVLHGDADTVVPVAEARALERIFKEKKVPHESRIYPGQGHGFKGADDRDALDRTLRFLERYVKKTAVAEPKTVTSSGS